MHDIAELTETGQEIIEWTREARERAEATRERTAANLAATRGALAEMQRRRTKVWTTVSRPGAHRTRWTASG